MPAPASCPAHSLSADSSSGSESCPPLQRLLSSVHQADHQDDEVRERSPGPEVAPSALPLGGGGSGSLFWSPENAAARHPKKALAGPEPGFDTRGL